MKIIHLRKATLDDRTTAIDLDCKLDPKEHIELNRAGKIAKAISVGECFMISTLAKDVGFVIFDYRFFEKGWIELMIIDEAYRGQGIAG